MNHRPQRKSPRLPGYDYAQGGAYFVTAVTVQRLHLFGHIIDGEMHRSPLGEIAQAAVQHIPEHWPGLVDVDAFIVMPNHVHLVVLLTGTLPNKEKRAPTLGRVINLYKGGVTRQGREHNLIDDTASAWQSRYHDHIIRHERAYNHIINYIHTNPQRWENDTLFTTPASP